MTSKERVIKAIKRQELPDRVPIQFDLCESLLEKFADKYGINLSYPKSYYEDLTYRIALNELRTKMGSDIVVVGGQLGTDFKLEENADGEFINEFGMKMRQGPVYMDVIQAPLKDLQTAEEAEAYQFPDPHDQARYVQAEADIAKYKNEYFIIGDVEITLFALARQLLGMEKFFLDVMMGEEHINILLEKSLDFSLGVATELANRGVDAIWFGDDFGTQTGLIMDRDMWVAIFKPLYKKIIDGIKAVNPNIIIIQHSDGAVSELLDDLIEVGVEVFNPVQPGVPGHDPQRLKDDFGDRISYFGAIDQQYLLPNGTPEEIEKDVKEKIEILGKGGGYIIAPAHILQSDTSIENVEVFINAAKKYGKYN